MVRIEIPNHLMKGFLAEKLLLSSMALAGTLKIEIDYIAENLFTSKELGKLVGTE